jgi:murein DD-endopeptidase MepM/ murein hydrolase activator NlpD
MATYPVKDYSITQNYGVPGSYRKGYHSGIDLIPGTGDWNVYSPVSGEVIESRFASGKGADPTGWGNYIIVRDAYGYDSLFAHLASVTVKKGETVSPGTILGKIGSTGNSTGPHLHYEVWDGAWTQRNDINPLEFLKKFGGISVANPISFDFPALKNPANMSQDELIKYAGIGALVLGMLALARD